MLFAPQIEPLTDDEFGRVCRFIHKKSGIVLSMNKKEYGLQPPVKAAQRLQYEHIRRVPAFAGTGAAAPGMAGIY